MQVVLSGMRCIDIVFNIVKILGIYYSYNNKLEIQENFKRHIIKIEEILRIGRMIFQLWAKLLSLKLLQFQKIVHFALV